MSIQISKTRGRPLVPLLKSEIEEAQRHTNSNRAAAKWLNCSQARYKRYASIYGLYERHLNKLGINTNKGFASRPTSIPLRDIFANKHPRYSLVRLRRRMIARRIIEEKCAMCGFSDRRVTDKRMPVMLTFKETMGDYSKSNLELRCYNCMFLTTGAPWVSQYKNVKNSLLHPESTRILKEDVNRSTHMYDEVEDKEMETVVSTHYNSIERMKEEILRDLGR